MGVTDVNDEDEFVPVPPVPPRETARQALRKLVAALDNNQLSVFDARETEVLQQWARFLLATQSYGVLLNTLRQVIIWVGGAIVLYITIKGWWSGAKP